MYIPLYYYIVQGGTFLESDTNPQTVLEKLDDYFTGEINETMEQFNFNK